MVEREEGGFSSATPRRLAAAFSRRTVILNDEAGMVRTTQMTKMVIPVIVFVGSTHSPSSKPGRVAVPFLKSNG